MPRPVRKTICRLHYLCGQPVPLGDVTVKVVDSQAKGATPLVLEHLEDLEFIVNRYNHNPALIWAERSPYWEQGRLQPSDTYGGSTFRASERGCHYRHVIYRVTGITAWRGVGPVTQFIARATRHLAEESIWQYSHPIMETIQDLETQLDEVLRIERALGSRERHRIQQRLRDCYRILLAHAAILQNADAASVVADSQTATNAADEAIQAYLASLEELRRNRSFRKENPPPEPPT